ncbi:MAG: TraB/GumN family protein [Leptospiraceae bacterium]|nr:TraB/GumN family protein [Leptospiraceae bacterium]MDW8307452.1 TraB/GumN family protein [Leptospiraceae bacterium]
MKKATSRKARKTIETTNITTLTLEKAKIKILGTAHVSKQSVKDVEKILNSHRQAIVAVELCNSRFQAMMDKERWQKLNLAEVIKERKIYLLVATILLSIYQKRMALEMKTEVGAEMYRAIELAKAKGFLVELVDRDIQITLKRASHQLSFFQKMQLFSELLVALFSREKVDAQEIEKMREQDVLQNLLSQLPRRYWGLKKILLDERDKYMAQKIRKLAQDNPKKTIVAIVGSAHVAGIVHHIQEEHDLASLTEIPPKSKFLSLLQIVLPMLILLALFTYFTDFSQLDMVLRNLFVWISLKSTLPGFFALLVRAHPAAILSALLSGPISNFNPIFKPGWLAAFFEAKYRKPRVRDFENLAHDSTSLSLILKNRVLRIILLFILPQIASSLATILALWFIAISRP